tara:strand:- start:629 stop:787 length:159 start_codon:yes stop_codon:yes gene_type:complete
MITHSELVFRLHYLQGKGGAMEQSVGHNRRKRPKYIRDIAEHAANRRKVKAD